MLLTILVFLVVLVIVGGWFLEGMLAIRAQTLRQEEGRLAESVAQGLAVLGAHKIQHDLLSDRPSDQGHLRRLLVRAMTSFTDVGECPLPLDGGPADLQPLAEAMLQPLRPDGVSGFRIAWSLARGDFSPFPAPALPQEKAGYIRLRITIPFRQRSEEFAFALAVKVTAAWVPLLSKYHLFVDDPQTDARGDDLSPCYRFNLVTTTPDGELAKTSRAVPLVLHNGGTFDQSRPTDLESFARDRVGLIHFGGAGPTVLNLARGDSRGTWGESFHFFETVNGKGQRDGLYTVKEFPYKNGVVGLLQWDRGIADDRQPGWQPDWSDFVASTPEGLLMRHNSVFRLFGTDKGRHTPTLVTGNVFRGTISAKACQSEPPGLLSAAFLYYPTCPEDFSHYLDFDANRAAREGIESVATFARVILGLQDDRTGLVTFRRQYASRSGQVAYNASIGFITTGNREPNPFGNFRADLKSRMTALPTPPPPELSEVPPPLRDLLPPGAAPAGIPRLAVLLGKEHLRVPGDRGFCSGRASWDIGLASAAARAGLSPRAPDLWKEALAQHGLFDPAAERLDPQGWVFLDGDCPHGLVIDKPLTLKGNGGIVLRKGNIVVGAAIDGGGATADDRPPAWTLHLVALEGDILVAELGGKRVDAVLAASGRVLFRKGRPTIRGAVLTGRFDIRNASEGADLFYNENLAVLPKSSGDADVDRIVGCSVDPNPVFLP
ncbi:MAG: hypothetical protein GX442_08475 [Candidatus Riflebacteria bacterium]|nr:hypothetical protein [Candidatus Riflebacteria bacterium]